MTLDASFPTTPLPDFAEFYRTQYGQAITSLRPAGRVGATLLEAAQPAGDWSDAATADLVICELIGKSVPVSLNLGAGRITGRMAPHDLMIAPVAVATTVLVDAPHHIRVLAVPWKRMCPWADSDQLRLPADGDFGVLHHVLSHDRRLTRALDALWQQDDGVSAAGTLFSDALLIEVVATLVEMSTPQRTRRITGLTRGDLLRVDACMRARLAEDIGLADLAALTGLSVAHFCRAFKLSTGRSPYQALIDLRMHHAQELLGRPALSIAEVALACGYAQPAHFAKLFRRSFGVTPTDWRRERLS
jgi:AraC family transcriptional regulator